MIIIIIGTVASSFLGFRADLIKILIQKNHIVYAFTSEYTNLVLWQLGGLKYLR